MLYTFDKLNNDHRISRVHLQRFCENLQVCQSALKMGYWPTLYQFPNYYTGCSCLVHTEQQTYHYEVFQESFHTVLNRNQQVWLTRFRTSSRNLRIKSCRYTTPVTSLSQRVCQCHVSGTSDDAEQANLFCDTFNLIVTS